MTTADYVWLFGKLLLAFGAGYGSGFLFGAVRKTLQDVFGR